MYPAHLLLPSSTRNTTSTCFIFHLYPDIALTMRCIFIPYAWITWSRALEDFRKWRYYPLVRSVMRGEQVLSKNFTNSSGTRNALVTSLFCVCPISPLSPKVCFLARSGPPFVIRGIPIQWERSGLQMADLNERKNRVWGIEKGDRANTEYLTSFQPNLPHSAFDMSLHTRTPS